MPRRTALSLPQLSRESCVIILKLSIGANPEADPDAPGTASTPTPWVSPQDIPVRVAALLQALDLQRVDIVSVAIPSDPALFGRGCVRAPPRPQTRAGLLSASCCPFPCPPHTHPCCSDVVALLTVLEALVASGHTQYYGLECESFAVAPPAEGAPPSQPLRSIFELAEAMGGHATQRRKRLLAELAAAGVPEGEVASRLGNTVGRRGGGAPAQQGQGQEGAAPPADAPAPPAAAPAPAPAVVGAPADSPPLQISEEHHLACVTYPLNLGRVDALLPSVLDRQGK